MRKGHLKLVRSNKNCFYPNTALCREAAALQYSDYKTPHISKADPLHSTRDAYFRCLFGIWLFESWSGPQNHKWIKRRDNWELWAQLPLHHDRLNSFNLIKTAVRQHQQNTEPIDSFTVRHMCQTEGIPLPSLSLYLAPKVTL